MPDCSCASRHSVSADISISSDQTTSVPYSPTRTRRNKSRDWRRGSRHGTSRSNRTRQRGSRRPYPNGCARLEASCPPSLRQCAAKSSSASSTSFVEFSPFEGQHLSIGLRPCQHLSDLGRARFSSNHHQIRNPHQHLKVRRNDVEMRRPMIVSVHTHAEGPEALQRRHTKPSVNSATIALLTAKCQGLPPNGSSSAAARL